MPRPYRRDAALKRKPDFPEALCNRGITYYRKGEYEAAIADFTAALAIRPDFTPAKENLAKAFIHRGITYAGKGNYDAAIADYTAALDIKPDDANVYSNRGWVYCLKGD